MKPEHEKCLVSFDTDSIKEYIYATNSLKEIRGASAILIELEDERLKSLKSDEQFKLSDEDVAFAAGGSGSFLADSPEKAQRMAEWIESEFRKKTVTGSVTTVIVPPDDEKGQDWFKHRMASARMKMQRAKAFKAELISLPLEPYMRPCAACGVLPADTREQTEGELICIACDNKRNKGREERGYKQKFKEHISNLSKEKEAKWKKSKLAPDLTQLAELGGGNFIGFLTMDGNSMGRLLENIDSKEAYRAYSQKLKDTVEKIVFEALVEQCRPINGFWPFEIVLIGGDDLALFVKAEYAMPVALHIMHQFDRHSGEILQAAGIDPKQHEKLSMSASVVFCHPNFPIPALVDIADELLKDAKKFCAKNDYREGAIEFQVITGSAMNIKQARELMVHNRPYSLSKMEELLNHARQFAQSGFPASQLQMLFEACHESRVSGTMMVLRLLARLKNNEHRQLLRDFLVHFSERDIEKPTLWPWVRNGKKDDKLHSAVPDLIELANFNKLTPAARQTSQELSNKGDENG